MENLPWKTNTVNFTDGKNMLSAIVANRYNEKGHQQMLMASEYFNRCRSSLKAG